MKKILKFCGECSLKDRNGNTYENVCRSDIVIISDYPYEEDLKTGKIFSNKCKAVIDRVLNHVDLSKSKISFLNSVRCALDKKNDATKVQTNALKCCREYVKLAISKIEPKVIITLGDFALRQILHKQKIMENRGKIFWSDEFNCSVIPTVHPKYCLNGAQIAYPNIPVSSMAGKESLIFKDFELLKSFIDNDFKAPELDTQDYKKVDDINEIGGKYVSIDCETNGLDLFKRSTKVLCWGFSYNEGESEVIIL